MYQQIIIPSFIIENLKAYGNAAIGRFTFPKGVSDSDIINALKRENLVCRIVYTNWDVIVDSMARKSRKTKDITKSIHVISK